MEHGPFAIDTNWSMKVELLQGPNDSMAVKEFSSQRMDVNSGGGTSRKARDDPADWLEELLVPFVWCDISHTGRDTTTRSLLPW
jgi:hypothetical protein